MSCFLGCPLLAAYWLRSSRGVLEGYGRVSYRGMQCSKIWRMAEVSPRELFKKKLALEHIQETIARRMANLTSEEARREADSLVRRAFGGGCEFDRKHQVELLTLAIAPHEVSWQFKLRERLHRLIRRH
jgi:hypothetical protein